MQDQMNRKAFLAKAGAGTAAAASLPGLLGAQAAFAGSSNDHRVYTFVSFSQAPASGGVLPRIGARGSGTFDPHAGCGHYAGIQPAVLTIKADWEGIGSGLTMVVVCNVGPAGLSTGLEEGWFLEDTPYGDFDPVVISGVPLGITHLSVAGVSTDQGA